MKAKKSKSKQSPLRYRRIGIITKVLDQKAFQVFLQFLPHFKSTSSRFKNVEFWIEDQAAHTLKNNKIPLPKGFKEASLPKLCQSMDLLLVLGGDGTILRCSRFLLHKDGWKKAAVFGINAGNLGFLTSLSATEALEKFDSIFDNIQKCDPEPRLCLDVTIERDKKEKKSYQVLNDCVLSKGTLSRLFEVQVLVDGGLLAVYRSDGIVVSTPTGSTAYNLAAGGAVVEPSVRAFELTPICPQSFASKPIVFAEHRTIEMILGKHSSDVYLTLDGHTGFRIDSGDRVTIRASKKSISFVHPINWNYGQLLRAKFNWGLVSPPMS